MILNDEFMKEFNPTATFDHDIVLHHEKCGEESEPNLNLLGILEWADKHRYTCPEIAVESITVGSLEDGQYAVVTMLKDGRTQVDVHNGSRVVRTISRKLIQQKKSEKNDA